jgi:putative endonuclease
MRSTGFIGEQIAVNYLINIGHKIIARNFYTRLGELDIISKKGPWIHSIEVKSGKRHPIHPGYKINRAKQKRMWHVTELAMNRYQLWQHYVQFDLIVVTNDQINHIENIFNSTDVF